MKKIRFILAYGPHLPGHVIGTANGQAANLVNAGFAEYVADNIRPLKYAAGAPVQSECVSMPKIEELESAPKGAVLPPQISMYYDTPESEISEPEIKITAPKNKQTLKY